jgi:hypothetical protein
MVQLYDKKRIFAQATINTINHHVTNLHKILVSQKLFYYVRYN